MNFGEPPGEDELEICLFGPGYGEAVIVHVGEGKWLLVDSCINAEVKEPASSHYLRAIGVKAENVLAIIASHWHDDHVRGISKLAAEYPNADVFIPGVFRDVEAMAFVSAYGGASGDLLTGGTKELFLLTSTTRPIPTQYRTVIYDGALKGRTVKVHAFSPTPEAAAQALSHLVTYIPREQGATIRHAPELRPNLESIVVHVSFGDDAILLGSDLEEHAQHGWSALAGERWCLNATRASAYKVAHHGSETAEAQGIWNALLRPMPVGVMTPFNNGAVHLPKDSDEKRLKGVTSATYISSGATHRPDVPRDTLKRMTAICTKLAKVNSGFGAVRLRKKVGAADWIVDLFGNAKKL